MLQGIINILIFNIDNYYVAKTTGTWFIDLLNA